MYNLPEGASCCRGIWDYSMEEKLRRPTPGQILGPYYPPKPDLTADNDLTRWPGADRRAEGQIMTIAGTVAGPQGQLIADALVEAWQCDVHGLYRHPDAPNHETVDRFFEGYGRFTTAGDGAWSFVLLRPTPYPGRAPHVHFKVTAAAHRELITQMYIAGDPLNGDDFALARAGSDRDLLVVDLSVSQDDPAELVGEFSIVLETAE